MNELLSDMERFIAQKGLGWLLTDEAGFQFIADYLALKTLLNP